VALTLRAVSSALDQTHRRVEVVLVDDGSTEDISPLTRLAETEPRLRLLRQANAGPAAARNRALSVVQGDYIAFLDADDRFLPHKIERQLDQMRRHGALFSHTSYYTEYLGGAQNLRLSHSGEFGGACYPQIIGVCPIAMSTVMLHRSVVDGGFSFASDLRTGEDRLAWIDLATRYTLLGIDEPSSIVEWSDGCVALDPAKQVLGLSGVLEVLERHPVHWRQPGEIGKLREAIRAVARDWVAADRKIEAMKTPDNFVDAAFPVHPAFPSGGNGMALSALGRAA
jgi:hypothetical protein